MRTLGTFGGWRCLGGLEERVVGWVRVGVGSSSGVRHPKERKEKKGRGGLVGGMHGRV